MKKKFFFTFALFATLTLSACGVRSNENLRTPGTVAEVATGSAVSAVFKNSETSVKEARLANDYIQIWEDGLEWYQEKTDGTGKQKVELEGTFFDIVWLTNDWLYYATDNNSDEEEICRIPFQPDTDPMYDIDNKEVLVRVKYFDGLWDDFMVTDSYMLFDCESHGKSGFCQYDFETKKTTRVWENEYSSIILDEVTLMPLTTENAFFLICWEEDDDKDTLYRVSIDSLKKEKIFSYDSDYSSIDEEFHFAVANNNALYFVPYDMDGDIMKYDDDSRELTCILDGKEVKNIIDGFKIQDEGGQDLGYMINAFQVWNDRLYIGINTTWDVKEEAVDGKFKGEKITARHNRDILCSSDLEDLKQWTLEEGLHDYAVHNSVPLVWHDGDGDYIQSDSPEDAYMDIEMLHNNKVYFSLWQDNGYTKPFIYDIDTGKVEQMDPGDGEYLWFESYSNL